MPTYIGFSTLDVDQPRNVIQYGKDGGTGTITQRPYLGKKFTLTDEQLVLRDFLNSFNIKQGDKVGQPQFGTKIWEYVFDPNTNEILGSIEDEIKRVAAVDSRIIINTVTAYAYENGILIEVQMTFQPFNNLQQFGFYLNRSTRSIELMG
jgi:phage baseplate assembly protein W